MDCLQFIMIFFTFVVTFVGLNVLFVKNTPSLVVRLFAFGKIHKPFKKQDSFVKWFEIPKRWFFHFYVFAAVHFLIITASVVLRYFANVPSPFFVQLLNLLGSPERKSTVSAESVVIVSVFLSLHACKRLYECFYVSVYSDAKMNVLHYSAAFTYYFAVGLSVLHDAPGFQTANEYSNNYISGLWFTFPHCMGIMCLLLASILQFQTHKALATLRKTGDKVKSTGHYLPISGFFQYVSCPHFFAEIMIYLSHCLILEGKSCSWWLVCMFTICNQIISGIANHQWYKKTFPNYPVERKAIIPFLL